MESIESWHFVVFYAVLITLSLVYFCAVLITLGLVDLAERVKIVGIAVMIIVMIGSVFGLACFVYFGVYMTLFE